MAKLLFVLGARKTGTSTVVNVLNSCKQVFITYEFFLNAGRRRNYCSKLPEFSKAYDKSGIKQTFKNIDNISQTYGEFKYIGGKDAGIHPKVLKDVREEKHIFMIRDIRTWPAKNSIISYHNTNKDAIKPILDYTEYFISSFKSNTCIRISLEDLINNYDKTANKISTFLGLKISDSWWEQVGSWGNKLKDSVTWWEKHPTSTIQFKKCDTITTISDHKFWNDLLPIFDKYYNSLDSSPSVSEIEEDLKKVSKLRKFGKVPLKKLFAEIKGIKIT